MVHFRPLFFALASSVLPFVISFASASKDIHYVFDQNARGIDCDKAVRSHDAEDFRLYCINAQASFRDCALSCHEALHFEGTVGLCKSYRCDFYGFGFQEQDDGSKASSWLSMSRIAQGKVVLFALAPMWEGHVQYMYELLEAIGKKYSQDTEVLFLPIDIHDYSLEHPRFEIEPFEGEDKKVHLLQEVKPHEIGKISFLTFIRSLVHESGFPTFDVYTDRPVIFVINHDGTIVERMVVPTKEELEQAIQKYRVNPVVGTI